MIELGFVFLSALFVDHDRTDAMIVRAGCPSSPWVAAAIDFRAENDRERSTLAALYRTEGLCSTRAVGDRDARGRVTSYGPFQQHGRPGQWAWLLDDLDAAVFVALQAIRSSVKRCGRGDGELSEYARGKCDSARGRELSGVRVRLATFARGGR